MITALFTARVRVTLCLLLGTTGLCACSDALGIRPPSDRIVVEDAGLDASETEDDIITLDADLHVDEREDDDASTGTDDDAGL